MADKGKTAATDVVVVGTGVAGMTAAIEAIDAGARVIVLEKEDVPGGTTRLSGGTPWTFKYAASYHEHIPAGDPLLQSTVVEGLPAAYDWLDRLGMSDPPLIEVGTPRNAAGEPEMVPGHPVNVRRVVVTEWVETGVSRIGKSLRLSTGMRRLMTDQQGAVVGVLADGDDGPLTVHASAVVLATGGYGASREMLQRYVTPEADHLWFRNSGYVTGDGFSAAEAIGAAPSTGGFGSFYGHCLPARPARFSLESMLHVTQQYGPIGVALNLRGERYTDEGETRMEETMCLDTSRQPRATAFYIVDHAAYQDYKQPGGEFVSPAQGVDKISLAKEVGGVVIEAQTIDELCESLGSYGVPVEKAKASLGHYNAAASAGKAGLLEIPKTMFGKPLAKPPFYGVMVQSGVTATYGGIRVNERAEVLGRSGHAIPGLFACGIDIGNVNNRRYAGNWSIGLVFGRIAGIRAVSVL